MSVPVSAIVTRGQLTGIWIADPDGIARLRFVKTGRLLGERIEILSGLSEGDRVVTKSSATLEEGAQIADAMPDSGSKS
jgi:multidrug efflux pump subunit AcrA (membrane-fusion protein)